MILRRYAAALVLLLAATAVAQTSKPSSPQTPYTPSGPYPAMSATAEGRAREAFKLWDSGQTSTLFNMFGEQLKQHSGGEAKFAANSKLLREKMGEETKMLNEEISPIMLVPGTVYTRLSQFSKVGSVPVVTTVALDEQGKVQAMMIGPEQGPPEGRYAGHMDATKLRLPFNGEWFVAQGGHSVFENDYMRTDDQKFAYDFILLKNGRAFEGDPGKNESFHCFGQPILAPADGTVVKVEDEYIDNPPGTRSQDSPHGNIVVIAHGNKEFSSMDHLKQNSVKVKKGDTVKQGDVIAACGNSGASPGPHVHFQFQNTAGFPSPDPLPAQFTDYIANGKPVAVGEPVKGQTISNGPITAGSAAAATKPATTAGDQPKTETPPK